MTSGAISEEEMKYIIEKYKGDNVDKLFSTGLLAHPFNCSGPRQQMFSVHYAQHVILNNPETPRYFTGYEKTFGKYLNSYQKSFGSYEIIAKIARHSSFPKMSYLLVLKKHGRDEYDTIKVSHYEKLSDNHGYLRPFTYMDDKSVGSTINNDDIVYRANTLDEFGNYRYGVNAKTIYLLTPEVKEDSVVISESFAKRTSFNLVTKTEAVINKNDILCNMFGDINNYKPLLNIGETIPDNGILFATRKMDKRNISADFTDMALLKPYYTDNKFKGAGEIVDIDIKVNDLDELKSDIHREQLLELYTDQFRYNQEIYNVLYPIVKNQNNKVSTRLEQELFNATNYISPKIKYSSNTGNFDFAHITIYTAANTPLHSAMKMTNRCGAKAVIGKVWPDENMPVDINGVRADVICSSAGITGRANPDQTFEQLTNFTSDEIVRRMQKCKTIEESIALEVDYLKTMSPEWGEFVNKTYKSMSHKEKEAQLTELYNDRLGLYMYNPPANHSVSFQLLKEVTTKYKIKSHPVKMCREYKVSDEVAEFYDTKENIDAVKNIMKNYTFDTSSKTTGKGKDKETIQINNELGILDVNHNVHNQLGLKLDDYKDNTWIDDYTWSKSEIGIDQLNNDKSKPDDLVDYISNVQELQGEFKQDDFLQNQLKDASFDTTKSRVYRKDKNTLVREFTSKYPIIISDVYYIVLRQIPDNGFSARSLGSVTPLGLPNKSVKKSEIGKPYTDTCNQFSEMDNSDLKALCDPKKVSRFLAISSTHPDLRMEKAGQLLMGDPTKLEDLPYNDDEICDTVPVKMMNSYLSSIGLEVGLDGEKDPYEFVDGLQYETVGKLMSKVGVIPKEEETENK